MATNKERIEALEQALSGVQDGMQRMEIGMGDKLQRLEESLKALSEAVLSSRGNSVSQVLEKGNHSRTPQEEFERSHHNYASRTTKLEFPRYSGDDPTEWCNRATQFFEFQRTSDDQKVSLASFHLEGEANQWWQWLSKTYREEARAMTWEVFSEELWARFGPTDCEDFDEALSRVRQSGTLRDYQKEFERLGNRVQGWPQKALVGTFMGGLKTEIADGIRMFKPKTLKEAISLARMRDDQVSRQQKSIRSLDRPTTDSPSPTEFKAAPSMKRLTWVEMQKRRAQGLCFNCDEKFTAGHKCRGPQLLLLEGHTDNSEIDS